MSTLRRVQNLQRHLRSNSKSRRGISSHHRQYPSNMSPIPCFAFSTTTFLPSRPKVCRTCRRSRKNLLSIRRVRAATTEPDPESSQDAQQSNQITEDAFEQQVPGKIVLTELELAKQKAELDLYAKQLRQKRFAEEREAARLFGFVPFAETLNGRLAMFFIIVGLLTEYWTDYTIPEQVELMLRTLGII